MRLHRRVFLAATELQMDALARLAEMRYGTCLRICLSLTRGFRNADARAMEVLDRFIRNTWAAQAPGTNAVAAATAAAAAAGEDAAQARPQQPLTLANLNALAAPALSAELERELHRDRWALEQQEIARKAMRGARTRSLSMDSSVMEFDEPVEPVEPEEDAALSTSEGSAFDDAAESLLVAELAR